MKRLLCACMLMVVSMGGLHAQHITDDRFAVEMADLWDNWYVQVGLDMSLQNPCGYNFAKVFPNEKQLLGIYKDTFA